jgi:hypothetical protein
VTFDVRGAGPVSEYQTTEARIITPTITAGTTAFKKLAFILEIPSVSL